MKVADRKILIVLSGVTESSEIESYLKQFGYQIKSINGGQEGLKIATEWAPDLILVDLVLPDMGGLELLRELNELSQTKDSPVIIFSNDGSEETHMIALTSGAGEFFARPVPLAVLNAKIQILLELRISREKLRQSNEQLQSDKSNLLKYFSDDVVEHILEKGDEVALVGSHAIATMLFIDIRGSTSMAEKTEPMAFSHFINMIFGDLMDLIFKHNGSVNKLLGDGILATFGVPTETDQDALNCVLCVKDIMKHMSLLNEVKPDFLDNPLSMGAGIATGKVYAGNVGSFRRMEYTVLGDAVNLAARLEALTKNVPENILIDLNTWFQVSDKIEGRKIENAKIRGKSDRMIIYALD